ncbi:MAG: nucleotidyltransferase family protein, partial [Marinomonas sp.]
GQGLTISWICIGRSGVDHIVDLHWAVSNAPAIAEGLPFEDFFISKQELPQLSAHAYSPSAVHQLLQASVNQASHKLEGMGGGEADILGGRRLIWACDCHLISRDFETAHWDELIEKALVARLAGTMRQGLLLAQDTLGSQVPAFVMEALQRGARDDRAIAYFDAPSAAYRFAADVKASKGLAAKARVIKVHVMATPELLHARYPERLDAPLWQLRMRRIASIAWQSLGQLVR